MSAAPSGTVQALQAALAAEYAASWAYGVVGGKLGIPARPGAAGTGGVTVAQVAAAQAVHETRQAALVADLSQLRQRPVEPSAAYRIPFAVTDARAALRLAAYVEEGTTSAWRYLLDETADRVLRRTALDALASCAVTATRWRLAIRVHPATVALPGI